MYSSSGKPLPEGHHPTVSIPSLKRGRDPGGWAELPEQLRTTLAVGVFGPLFAYLQRVAAFGRTKAPRTLGNPRRQRRGDSGAAPLFVKGRCAFALDQFTPC